MKKPNRQVQEQLNDALIKAAAAGLIHHFDDLLGRGAELDAMQHGTCALAAATIHNQVAAARQLLELKAQVDVADAQGRTALAHAVQHRHTDIGTLLVQAGADINGRNSMGSTLLTHAALLRDQHGVAELLALRADVNATNISQWSALALAGSDVGIVRSLLDARADTAHAANKNVVLNAVCRGSTYVAQLLLKYGATPNATDYSGKATLAHAVDNGDAGLVRSLVDAKADPNQGANQQALASANAWSNPAVLQVLLEAGARPDISGPAGHFAVMHAFERNRADIVARWFPANSVPQPDPSEDLSWILTPLPCAVSMGHVNIIHVLRDAGYCIHICDAHGYNVLMLASALGEPRVVEALLVSRNGFAGADPNARGMLDGKTALMLAAEMGNTSAMKVLLAAGANPDAVDNAGCSVLEHAVQCKYPEHRHEVQSILAHAMAVRALAFAAQLPQIRSDEGFAEIHEDAAGANGDGRATGADWTDMLHDGAVEAAAVEAAAVETAAVETAAVGCATTSWPGCSTEPTL